MAGAGPVQGAPALMILVVSGHHTAAFFNLKFWSYTMPSGTSVSGTMKSSSLRSYSICSGTVMIFVEPCMVNSDS